MNPPDGELMTVADLAAYLGLSPRTIYNRRYRGDDLPAAIRIGGAVRYRRSVVEEWLAEHEQATTKTAPRFRAVG